MRGLALAALSGAALGLAFPPWNLEPLAWVALVPLLIALRRAAGPGAAAACAAAFALGLWGVVWHWGPHAVVHYFGQPWTVGLGFFAVLALGTVAPPVALFAWAYRRCATRAGVLLPWAAGAAWAGAELLRGRLVQVPFPAGNSWALLGASQVGSDAILQLARLGGAYAIAFVLVAANAGLAEAWLRRRGPGPSARTAGPLAAGAVAPLLLGLLPGLVGLAWGAASLRSEPAPPPAARVALVQPDLRVESRFLPSSYGAHLEALLALSERAVQGTAAQLLVWPESSMTFFLEEEPGYRRALASHLSALGIPLIAGAPRRGADGPRNSVYRIDPDGSLRARYDKRLLIPFAEYPPLGIDLLRRDFGDLAAFVPGEPRPPLPTPLGPAGVLVCNESMFAEVAAQRVDEGAEWLLNLANDAWIPSAEYAEQQLELAALRAAEQGRPLVRVSTSGPSAAVDARGRIVMRSRPFGEAVLTVPVSPRRARTVYGRVGDLFAVLCAAGALALALAPARA